MLGPQAELAAPGSTACLSLAGRVEMGAVAWKWRRFYLDHSLLGVVADPGRGGAVNVDVVIGR